MRRMFFSATCFVLLATFSVSLSAQKAPAKSQAGPKVSGPGQMCLACHANSTPGIVEQWRGSAHAKASVDCYSCHQAMAGDPATFDHYGQKIAVIVTPNYCARCHAAENAQFQKSHHAQAAQFIGSLDNMLGEIVEGGPAAVNGCRQCHGSIVQYLGEGKFSPDTWPNSGIGRVNPDGSKGTCAACHGRHAFSSAQARQPENCGKCHLGPDHPQKEIYEESKHGVAYRDLREQMNLDADSWVLGKDYSQAPTCATCHMSGNTRNGGRITHDPGERISWTNRPPVSQWLDKDKDGRIVTETDPAKREALVVEKADEKRQEMKNVCLHCHTPDYVNGFYKQYDDFVILYNEKFAKPGQKIMGALRAQKLLTKADFDEEIEFTWFFLWHHEGRRARHGASMMAPDYAHWHGMYEVADRFYMGLIPQAREIAHHAREEGKNAEAEAVETVIEEILARPEHEWFMKEKGR